MPRTVRAESTPIERFTNLRAHAPASCRTLGIVLGDQLDHDSTLLRALDPAQDAILMMEVAAESTHVPSHAQRTVLFLSAMRHFAAHLDASGWRGRVRYITLDDAANTGAFGAELTRALRDLTCRRCVVVEPGEHRVQRELVLAAEHAGAELSILPDAHFLTPPAELERWAAAGKPPIMEYFYRRQRQHLKILVDERGQPEGGAWNYDAENRSSFGKTGPKPKPRPPTQCAPDALTQAVIDTVRRVLPSLPGKIEPFAWPVTRDQALAALDDFITHRLERFGPYEDAMWTNEPVLYHSALSSSLNLKLLSPRECVDAALAAYRGGRAPLQSVEGFVRQLIGWREYIRNVYFTQGPSYAERNGLEHFGSLPGFYWTGSTDMNCMRHALGQVLATGYGHHIQRLMVTGNFALIAGVHPREVSDWFLGMYTDAVDWVTLPNTLGMAMHADGTDTTPPVVGTKPYAAGGAYIKRMSNYCTGCRYDPARRTGENACPFTVFYWDFLLRHRAQFSRNPRMATILSNLDRFGSEQCTQITVTAKSYRERFGIGDISSPRRPVNGAASSYS